MAQTAVETSGRPAWLMPAAAFLCLCVAGGMGFIFLRQDRQQIGPPLPRTLTLAAGDMVIVPAGPFFSGEKKEEVILPSFYVDVQPVSGAVFARFCAATGRTAPATNPALPVANLAAADAEAFAAWAHKRLPTARELEKARLVLKLTDPAEPTRLRCVKDPD